MFVLPEKTKLEDYSNMNNTGFAFIDLNEELTELIKFQTAYSASARVFSTCNSLLDTLISLGL